jgi:flavin reductase (DIM6/NTAB) family NADH-FMN oxidoreductase RutF
MSAGPDLSPTLFRQGMRRLAGACCIVTSAPAGAGRDGWSGLTATAVNSLTAEPPRLLTCVNRSVWAHRVITESGVVGINVLATAQETLARRFAGQGDCAPAEKFQAGAWRQDAVTGAPLLDDALVGFGCRVFQAIDAGTHDIFICDVLSVRLPEGDASPLLYFSGAFRTVPAI